RPTCWCSMAVGWSRSGRSTIFAPERVALRAHSRTWSSSCSAGRAHMLGRELPIVLRARLTWLQAAFSALLVGHGFVLAVDLYAAGSRSAIAHHLMTREFNPLLGIVRPTLGGLYLALSLLGPLAAVRPIAVEKERRTL